jgi:hypothetical protein
VMLIAPTAPTAPTALTALTTQIPHSRKLDCGRGAS